MKHAAIPFAIAVSLALFISGQGFSQSAEHEAAITTAAAPVAYVYVPTPNGIYAYDASSTGKLTLVAGSPFRQTVGLAIGSTGKYFITLGTTWVHAYAIKPNGAIGKQVSRINTLNHGGGDCEYSPDNVFVGTDGAVLDHAGQNVYVFMWATDGGGDGCAAYQTYNIASNGDLIFNTSSEWYTPSPQERAGGLLLTGSNELGYAFLWHWGDSETPYYGLYGYKRGSQGGLEGIHFTETDPEAKPGYGYDACGDCSIAVDSMAADGNNHLAVAITSQLVENPYGGEGSTQLASYSVDKNGNISSINTWKNMPTLIETCPCSVCGYPSCTRNEMVISPAGNLLALATGTGVQFFHFNGAKPITRYTGIVGKSGYISHMSWDRSNHLYAVNGASGRLHVYQVTPTIEKEVAGSPYTLPGGATNVFAVSK